MQNELEPHVSRRLFISFRKKKNENKRDTQIFN